MSERIPDEAVERAILAGLNSQRERRGVRSVAFLDEADPVSNRVDPIAMRAALEASGAVFLTDEEREALRRFLLYRPLADPGDSEDVWRSRWACIEAVRERLL